MDTKSFCKTAGVVGIIGVALGVAVRALRAKRMAEDRADEAELGEAFYRYGYHVQSENVKALKKELEKSKSDCEEKES